MKVGKVLKIYPFLGIFDSLYYKTKTKLRCGSGYANYTINTNGNIFGRMSHPERMKDGRYHNIPKVGYHNIFKNGVNYFL